MQSILFRVNDAAREALIAALWAAGTDGLLEEDGDLLRAFFRDDADLSSLAAYCRFALEWRLEEPAPVAAPDWEPFLIGERFLIVPSGIAIDCSPGRHKLTIDSDTAFGTGRHESTQLMIEAMERYLRPQYTVLDVGCGSGILSASAAALGVGRVFACDIHWDALPVASRHFEGPLFAGAVDSIASASIDVALVNISAAVIDLLAEEIQRAVKPGGLILLAGFISARTPQQFTPEEVFRKGEWECWVLRSSGATRVSRSVQPFSQQWWL